MKMMEFADFPKMARWSRDIIVTEKIDGTNAQIFIGDDGEFLTGSRTRWITPQDDNHGFAAWAQANRDELMKLGPGRHFGEWWGAGIQRKYSIGEKRFSLFNVSRWFDSHVDSEVDAPREGLTAAPKCCHVVPILIQGPNDDQAIKFTLDLLRERGSYASPGFMDPEGIVIWHTAANVGFKKTLHKDEVPKTVAQRQAAFV